MGSLDEDAAGNSDGDGPAPGGGEAGAGGGRDLVGDGQEDAIEQRLRERGGAEREARRAKRQEALD